MDKLARNFYRLLLAASCVAMLAAFACVALGIAARIAGWDLPGLDAYAGYAIAASLFLALPATLLHGEHIRVTLLLERLPPGWRAAFEWACLLAGTALSLYLAWAAVRLAWVSHATHDVSPAADATPLWLPQLAMVLGCAGFAIAFLHALAARWRGADLVAAPAASHSE
ncbi:MAG: TRAP transporter small permease [Burkholderiales bacterium]|nr:TRAP transporter small permease [Burkholderiales bacterium]